MDTYDPEDEFDQPEDSHVSPEEPSSVIGSDEEEVFEGVAPPLTPPPIPPSEDAYEEPYAYDDYDDAPQAPLEPINPWIGIITQPRETIRYILDSGKWNNIWAMYGLIFLISIPNMIVGTFMQPIPPEFSQGPGQFGYLFGMGIMLVVMLVLAYPFGMLMVYLIGFVLRITGGWLDGIGTTAELRIAMVWSYIVSSYMSIIMLIPYGLISYYNHTNPDFDPAMQMMTSAIIILVSLPSMFIMLFYGSKCIGEAHQFSAWRGLGTILLTVLIWMAFWVALWIGIMIMFVGIIAAIGAMG